MPIHGGNRTDERPSQQDDHFNERATVPEYWWRVPKRYVLAVMAFSGVFIFEYMTWIFFGFMEYVYKNEEFREEHHPHIANWTESETIHIFRSVEWGFIVGQIPGALMAMHFSAHKLMTIVGVLSSIMHIATPLTFSHYTAVIIVINFLRGITLAPLYSTLFRIWGFWAPPKERTRLMVMTFCGSFLARHVYDHLVFFLIDNLGSFAAFLIGGIFGILWSLLWYLLIYDTPRSHPNITQTELMYLEQSIPTDSIYKATVKSIPIKAMFTSFPVLSFMLTCVIFSFGYVVVEIAAVMDYITDVLKETHILVEIFNFPGYLFVLLFITSGFMYDLLINKNFCSPTVLRKIMCAGGMVLSGIMFSFTFIEHMHVISLTLTFLFLGISASGLKTNALDLSPGYASILIAVLNVLTSAIFLIFGKVIYTIIGSTEIYSGWIILKGVTSGLLICAGLVFAVFGSAQEQPWTVEQQEFQNVQGANYYPRENTDVEDLELITESL